MTYLVITFNIFFVLTLSFLTIYFCRKAIRGIWVEHEKLKNSIREQKHHIFRSYRELYSHFAGCLLNRKAPVPFHSQYGEDTLLWNFFKRKEKGFYVEVGAFDGIILSNTYAFESIGWNGILIEANPKKYKECCKNRPHSIVVHAAVGGPGSAGNIEFSRVNGKGAELLSFLKADEGHIKRCIIEGGTISKVTVPYRTLDNILDSYCQEKIDFISIDVEGVELDVLQAFDLNRYKPSVIMIENNSLGSDDSIKLYLDEKGYKLVHIVECNEFYVPFSEERPFSIIY